MLVKGAMFDWLVQLGVPADFVQGLTPALFLSLGQKVLLIILTVIVGRFALRLLRAVIERAFRQREGSRAQFISAQRATTLTGLLNSVGSYVVNFIVILAVLEIMGIPTEHVLAGAGILGLAIGFGAQSLVKDIITGFFILYEDQFGVGDVVEFAGVTGTVEEMGLRVTTLRDFDGSTHIIPNADIGQVNNKSRGNSRVILDVDIAYEEDVDKALEVLQELCNRFEDETLVEGPNVLGIQALGASAVTIRMLARTRPLEHWGVERRLRHAAMKALEAAQIEIPYNRVVMVPPEATKIGNPKRETEG